MDQVSEMGEAPLGRLLLKFSLPSIAVMLLNSLYNFIDRIFIGQGMGTQALAAVTAGFPMMLVAEGFGTMLSVGAATLISIEMGAGRREKASSILSQVSGLALIIALPIMAASWIFRDPILRLFGTTSAILPLARSYIGIITIGFIFQILSMSIVNSLRSQNQPRAAMAATVSGTVLNAILAPIFIFACRWGIAGAAIATVAAQAFSCIITLVFVQHPSSLLKIAPRLALPKTDTMLQILKLGLPLLLVHVLALVMLIVANNSMVRFGGDTALAIIGIINTLMNLMSFPIMGITQGAGALWGYNFGAGKLDRVRKLTEIVIVWTTGISLVLTAIMELFPRAFIAAFNGSDPQLIQLGAQGMSVFMLSFFTAGLQFSTANFFMAIGKAAQGGILYVLRQILMIAGMAVLPAFMGIAGIYWTGPITDIVCSLVSAILLARGMRSLQPNNPAEQPVISGQDIPGLESEEDFALLTPLHSVIDYSAASEASLER